MLTCRRHLIILFIGLPFAEAQTGRTLRLPSRKEYFEWGKPRDLSSGVAVPTYPADIRLAANGKSRFAGMPEDNFLNAVNGALSSGPE